MLLIHFDLYSKYTRTISLPPGVEFSYCQSMFNIWSPDVSKKVKELWVCSVRSFSIMCVRERKTLKQLLSSSVPPITDYSTPVTAGTFVRAAHHTALPEPLIQPTCMLLATQNRIRFSLRFTQKEAIVIVLCVYVWSDLMLITIQTTKRHANAFRYFWNVNFKTKITWTALYQDWIVSKHIMA